MSNNKDRLAIEIAGFANLVTGKGDMIVGDGEQASHLLAASGNPGDVLTLSPSSPLGLAYLPGAGGTVTGSNGVTVALNNATNDLVTATLVAQVTARTSGDGNVQILPGGTGGVLIDTTGGGSVDTDAVNILAHDKVEIESDEGNNAVSLGGPGIGINISASTTGTNKGIDLAAGTAKLRLASGGVSAANGAELTAGAGGVTIDPSAGGAVVLDTTTGPGGTVAINSGLGVNVTANGPASDINVSSAEDIFATAARNLQLEADDGNPGAVKVLAPTAGGGILVDAAGLTDITGSGVRVQSKAASQLILASGANTLMQAGGALQATAGGNVSFTNGAGSNSGFVVNTDGTGDVSLNASARILATASGGAVAAIDLDATDGGFIASNNTGSRLVIGVAGDIQVSGGGASAQIDIVTSANNNIVVTTNGTGDLLVNPNHDETHTVGRNFSVAAAGAGGVSLVAAVGNATLAAGDTDGSGELRFSPTAGVPGVTRTVRFFNGAGTPQGTVTSPGGGVVVDIEARAQLSALLSFFFNMGLLTDPNP